MGMVLRGEKMKYVKKKRINRFWTILDEYGKIDMSYNIPEAQNLKWVKDCWKNEPCIILACGPSLKDFDLRLVKGMHSIGINHLIEDFDKFEWHFFLDQKFLDKTTYDLKNFKGKIFCQNICRTPPGLDVVKFKVRKGNPNIDMNINKGLYGGMLSGVSALHLALITGASPIYMIGSDAGGKGYDDSGYHYKPDYTAERKEKGRFHSYVNRGRHFRHFVQWKDRIINLSEISSLNYFVKKRVEDIPFFKKKIEKLKGKKPKIEINQVEKICHVTVMDNIKDHNEIIRNIYNNCRGNHFICNIMKDYVPHADVYIVHSVMNKSDKFKTFKRPYHNSKVISIIHSPGGCTPAEGSDVVIALTKAEKRRIDRKGCNSIIIEPGIDYNQYHYGIDYNDKNFGRITRSHREKCLPVFDEIAYRILDKHQDSKCYMISRGYHRFLKNRHERFLVWGVDINDTEKKLKQLSHFSLFTAMHGKLPETFNLSLLEGMLSGHCCLMYSQVPQPSMKELGGDAVIWVDNVNDYEKEMELLLLDSEKKQEYGTKAIKRGQQYNIEKMIKKYNNLIKDLLCKK